MLLFRTASETPRSASPFIGSETGTVSDELPVAKPKGKSKAKKTGWSSKPVKLEATHTATEDAEFNLHRRKVESVKHPRKLGLTASLVTSEFTDKKIAAHQIR